MARNNTTKAREYFRRSAAAAASIHDTRFQATATLNEATAALDAGDYTEAAHLNDDALPLVEQAADPNLPFAAKLNRARIGAAQGDPETARSLFMALAASPLLDKRRLLEARAQFARFLASQGQTAEAKTMYRQALDLLESSRASLQRPEFKLTYASNLTAVVQNYVAFLLANGASDEALEVAESSRARLLAEKLTPPAVTIAQLKNLSTRTHTTLLSYWIAPGASSLWVIRNNTITRIELPGEETLRPAIEAYRKSLDQDFADALKNPRAGLHLYNLLLEKAAPLLPKGSRVAIVPDGPLHALNFESIPVPGPSLHYWLEDVTLSVVPSLGFLLAPRTRTPPPSRLLLIGNPVSPDEKLYPPLASARIEIDQIKRDFPPREVVALTGQDAHPDSFAQSQPTRFAIIHFASHAEANRDSPLDSAVILSRRADRYKLYAREIRNLPLNADLVTVSACRSAGQRIYAGEGLVGFAWTFLESGARNVIAGLWEVDDTATAQLMGNLYHHLHDGAKPAAALRQAKLDMLAEGGNFRKPYYWAPFQTFSVSLD